ncbi:PBP1A family penicillin-binding protein [Candidatus Shapirobacteria bacterium]|nr:PBP1A family penicillin-binding protein [Candidatus Shapirobacteria bacterium]
MAGTNNKKKIDIRGITKNRFLVIGLAVLIPFVIFMAFLLKDMPNPRSLTSDIYPENSQIMDRNGKLIYEIFSEKRRNIVKIDDVPERLVKATLAVEDANFYSHIGFDLRGIVRGLFRTLVQKRLQGGSTITQQLVKNALLTPERTWTRKVKEALLTVSTEVLYTKKQILEMYFNQTPYGGTLWGVGAAAKGIFNKEVKDLTTGEAALLAGLPGSPTRYSPFAHPDAAKKRQELVLTRMRELDYITEDEKLAAEKEPLNYYINKDEIVAPHFVFYVKEMLVEKYGAKLVNEGGLKITTTLDSNVQEMMQHTIASETTKLAKQKISNGAGLVTEPKTGQILAMVGSKDFFANDIEGKFNVTTALRQPGSSIKPLNYATGIEMGKVTAATIFDDSPTCFKVENQKMYCPTNYGGRYSGIQSLRNSLGNSLNIPAVKTIQLVGLENFVATASAMGISTYKDPSLYGLSITLGGGEVMMTEMNTAFGVFANGGIRQNLVSVLNITDRHGKVLESYQDIPGERVLSRDTSFIITDILSDDGSRSMVFGRGSLLTIKGHPEVSAKTGTTNDLRDNWTIGYTPDFVTTVWVGNNDNSKMGYLVSGTTGAAPIWNKVMTYLLKDKPVKKPVVPVDVQKIAVCNFTGELPPEAGCDSHYEYFKKEYSPTKRLPIKNNVLIDKDTNRIVKDGEVKTNVEWQEHQAVRDASGVWVCLDCPLNINPGDTTGSQLPTTIINQ